MESGVMHSLVFAAMHTHAETFDEQAFTIKHTCKVKANHYPGCCLCVFHAAMLQSEKCLVLWIFVKHIPNIGKSTCFVAILTCWDNHESRFPPRVADVKRQGNHPPADFLKQYCWDGENSLLHGFSEGATIIRLCDNHAG